MITSARSRVSLLILAHLGLGAAACTKEPAPEAPAAPLVVGTGAATAATPTPTPVASTTGSAPPVVVPVPPPEPATPTAGKPCKSDVDCTGWDYCRKSGNEVAGTCSPRPTRGRVLVVDGVEHVAAYTRPAGCPTTPTPEELVVLRHAAVEEHASIAAFARTICELMALGAPHALLAETHAALGDELRHTERTLAVIEHITGERPAIGRLAAATAPLARSTGHLFRDVFRGGAIGETMAAADAEARRSATEDAELRAFYEMLVVDESRHAALAFETLRWLLAEEPGLVAIAREERARMSLEARALVGPLLDAAAIG